MRVPLFPLPNLVLFPGVQLPLYVFEPRYRALLTDVQASGEPFGIVQIMQSSQQSNLPFHERVSRVGTLAYLRHVQGHEDGTSSILVAGGERFKVQAFEFSKLYLSADIETWPLNTDPLGHQAQQATARTLLSDLLRLNPQDAAEIRQRAPEDPLLLASFAATLLPLLPAQKETALASASLLDRLEFLLSTIPSQAKTLN